MRPFSRYAVRFLASGLTFSSRLSVFFGDPGRNALAPVLRCSCLLVVQQVTQTGVASRKSSYVFTKRLTASSIELFIWPIDSGYIANAEDPNKYSDSQTAV